MIVELIQDLEEFKKLKEAWNDLLDKSQEGSIFLTWEWIYYWWIHFGGKNKLFILLVRNEENGKLLGIAPFYIEKRSLFGLVLLRKIKFLGSEIVASDFLDFIIYPGLEAAILKVIYEYLVKINYKWDIVEIGDIEQTSISLGFIKTSINENYRLLEQNAQTCPFIQLPTSYEMLLKTLSRKMRSNIKRSMNQIQSKDDAKVLVSNQKDQLKHDIDMLFNLHDKGFKKKGLKSSFIDNEIKNFHYDISAGFLSNGWLKLYFLEIKNQLVASLYAFRYKDRTYYYQSGIDPKCSYFGLGIILHSYCISDSINDGLSEFHFLRGNEEYKYRWTKESKKTLKITVFNNSFLGAFLYYHGKTKNFLKRFFKNGNND